MNALFAIIMFIITWTRVKPDDMQYTNSNIMAGAGYSSDSQQVVAQVCYNATVSSTSAQQGYMQLDSALSFSELENKLGMSVSVGGKFGMFSAEAKARYMRSMQDKDYSMSLNYYEYATNTVKVQLAGYGDKALTESGKGFYNDSKNPYFGLVCGDNYITDYQQGALLIMGINIRFSSSNAKKEFQEKVGASFGNIVSAEESVKSIVTKYKITGSIMLQAFQMGGEPSQLANILNKDSTGQYYALSCSLTAMDKCIKAASGLLDYAKDDFSTQFSFKNNIGLTPLGIAFSQYHPIEYIGLIPPASLVTDEVARYRAGLASSLKENQYYQQKFYSFLDEGYYPVKLDGTFMDGVKSILSEANSNVKILMQPHGGAADCFNFPDKCKNIKADIDSQLQNVAISAVKLLEDMKYGMVSCYYVRLYNNGGGRWDFDPDSVDPAISKLKVEAQVSETEYSFSCHCEARGEHNERHFEGLVDERNPMVYNGTICIKQDFAGKWQSCGPFALQKFVSPFFFEAYSAERVGPVLLI